MSRAMDVDGIEKLRGELFLLSLEFLVRACNGRA